jgi:hypothetical protein
VSGFNSYSREDGFSREFHEWKKELVGLCDRGDPVKKIVESVEFL